jgi:hypothetical protein
MMLSGAKPISSLEELRIHLQLAIGLELSTIPVYLTGLYSIVDGENTAASNVIQSVAIEEMLHMALAGNVLNAIGGIPSQDPIDSQDPINGNDPIDPIPHFPTSISFLPGLGVINLRRFSREALDTFIKIEHPDTAVHDPSCEGYSSIGAFYAAISQGIKDHCPPKVFEEARKSRAGCQISSTEFYGGSGVLIPVSDQKSALQAIETIVEQGEGIPEEILQQHAKDHGVVPPNMIPVDDGFTLADGWKMYSHYVRFREIRIGRRYEPCQIIEEKPRGDVLPRDWDQVYPMAANPQAAEYRGTDIASKMDEFNQTYSTVIDNIYHAFNGEREKMREAVTVMWDLKYQAIALMKTPSPVYQGETVGAPFEYLR